MKSVKILFLLILLANFISCKRDEKCETATLTGMVKHHAKLIPSAKAYIKKGSRNAPADARNPASYDKSVQAGTDAVYVLGDLETGDYYLFATGYDDAIADSVFGGIPLTIECKDTKQTINSDIPVVE